MRYLIGIDVSKFKHTASVIDNDGVVYVEPFDFNNDIIGFQLFLSTVSSFTNDDYIIGMEDTGHYGDNLQRFLLSKELKVAMLNPLATNHIRLAFGKAKNDKLDSVTIGSALAMPRLYRIIKDDHFSYHEIRELTRYRLHLTKSSNIYKNRLKKLIDITFPEFDSLFSTAYSNTYLKVLHDFQSAENIASTDIRTLRKALIVDRGRCVSITAEELKSAAKQSIGHSNFAMEIEIRQTVEMIEKINSNLEAVEKKIEEFSRQLNSPILAIPGISHISAMSILAEIGDFSKYESAKQIIKLSGTNPFVYESGTYSMARTRLEKKGSKYLRATLYKTIQAVILFNPVFNQYYVKKRAEGKSHLCAQGHCVRKLLRIIYHILTTGKEFDPALLR